MINADFHTHSSFSTDSEASQESMIEQAIAVGLKTYCFTDHMDYVFPEDEGFNAFLFDPGEYFAKLTELRKKYRGQIDIRIGVELGLRDEPDIRDEVQKLCRNLTDNYPFDFVIGSTHVIDHFDPYNRDRWNGRSPEDIVRMYFESVLYSVCHYDCFHVYGHLDYILRYLPEGVTIDMTKFDPLIDQILTELIARGKGIEVNTSRLARGGVLNPSPKILARYRELGGTLLTIGSDAHKPYRIAGAFGEAETVLKQLGYTQYTTFRKGKPSFRKF